MHTIFEYFRSRFVPERNSDARIVEMLGSLYALKESARTHYVLVEKAESAVAVSIKGMRFESIVDWFPPIVLATTLINIFYLFLFLPVNYMWGILFEYPVYVITSGKYGSSDVISSSSWYILAIVITIKILIWIMVYLLAMTF